MDDQLDLNGLSEEEAAIVALVAKFVDDKVVITGVGQSAVGRKLFRSGIDLAIDGCRGRRRRGRGEFLSSSAESERRTQARHGGRSLGDESEKAQGGRRSHEEDGAQRMRSEDAVGLVRCRAATQTDADQRRRRVASTLHAEPGASLAAECDNAFNLSWASSFITALVWSGVRRFSTNPRPHRPFLPAFVRHGRLAF